MPGPGQALLKVEVCGVCGTDHHIYLGEYMSPYPIVGGHEFAGVIAALGPDVKGWQVGDRVAADPNVFCGDCYYCKSNRANHCLNFDAVGVTLNGAFAEYVLVPTRTLYALPPGLSFEEAALVEPVSCVVYALSRVKIVPRQQRRRVRRGPHGAAYASGLRGIGSLIGSQRRPRPRPV